MGTLRATYGLRRVSLVAVGVLLPASTIHLLNLPSEQSFAHLNQGLQDFQSMSLNHPFAARCAEIIRALADKWNIPLPECMVAAKSAGLRQWSSDPPQTFWAASVPRTESSDSGTRSDESISDHRESSFRHSPCSLEQQHASFSPVFTGTTIPSGADQPHDAFWTPFAAQTMPVPPQNILQSMPMDYVQQMEGQAPQWNMYDNLGAHPASNMISNHYLHERPAHMDETMNFGGWHWQNR